MRTPTTCQSGKDCPGGMRCRDGVCRKGCRGSADCAQGERCAGFMCATVCYQDNNCLFGEVCVDGACRSGCRSAADCGAGQTCNNGQCACAPGYVADDDSCEDVDECENRPCHPTATCLNLPGSFKCVCPEGTAGNPLASPGCGSPSECDTNTNCAGNLACTTTDGRRRCTDPCTDASCGAGAECRVVNHEPVCRCPSGYQGDPTDRAVGCFRPQCSKDTDCPADRLCDDFRCVNPCDFVRSCGRGNCQVQDHRAVCFCNPGFEQGADGLCVDIDECRASPCHRSAECRNTLSSFSCVCPPGTVGDPVTEGCRRPGECQSDSDCPPAAACKQGRCQNPCESARACGKGAECTTVAHRPVCSCPPQTTGNPRSGCTPFECIDSADCAAAQTCVRNKCVDPCSQLNVCGANADCAVVDHQSICTCQPGYTGEARLGCTVVQRCSGDEQCPQGQRCSGGVCADECRSRRDCLQGQLCLEGTCRPTCAADTECPQYHSCVNQVCVLEARCRADVDCGAEQRCRTNAYGQAECQDVCNGLVLCGRNAECQAKNREVVCACKPGFRGDPQDEKTGCSPVECEKNTDCQQNQVCDNYKCVGEYNPQNAVLGFHV